MLTTQDKRKVVMEMKSYIPKKVRLSFELTLVCGSLLPHIQLSFNHLNEHFLSFNFGNLKVEDM